MESYFQGEDYVIWEIITEGSKAPTTMNEDGTETPKKLAEYTKADKEMVSLNARAKNVLYCALGPTEFNRVAGCRTAKEIWDKLAITHEGTKQVRETRISILMHDYEMFRMIDGETVAKMFDRLQDIVNPLMKMGKTFEENDIKWKILRSVLPVYQSKVDAIEENPNFYELTVDEVVGKLMAKEITLNKDKQKSQLADNNRGVAFKVSSSTKSSRSDYDESEDEGSDEDFAMLVKGLKKLFHKRRFRRFKRNQPRRQDDEKLEDVCYKCKKPGHYKNECPLLQKNVKEKRRTAYAAWSASEDEDDQEEPADTALMGIEDESDEEVNNETPSYAELNSAFEDLLEAFNILKPKYLKARKDLKYSLSENIELKNKLEIIAAETDKQAIEHDSKAEDYKTEILKLKTENKELRDQVDDLNVCLGKFVKGTDTLGALLGQEVSINKEGLGYTPVKRSINRKNMKEPVNRMLLKRNDHEKNNQTILIKSRYSQQANRRPQQYIRRKQNHQQVLRSLSHLHVPNIQCHYCGNQGHTSRECLHRKYPDNTKFIWVAKSKQPTRTQQLKTSKSTWILTHKPSCSCRNAC